MWYRILILLFLLHLCFGARPLPTRAGFARPTYVCYGYAVLFSR